jgi:hypothetical protein
MKPLPFEFPTICVSNRKIVLGNAKQPLECVSNRAVILKFAIRNFSVNRKSVHHF